MPTGMVPDDIASRFRAGFDEALQAQKVRALMQSLSGIFDPVNTPAVPPSPTGAGIYDTAKTDATMGSPAGSAPAGRTDVARRAMQAIGQNPEMLAVVEKMFGDYFKPAAPQAMHNLGEHGTLDPATGRIISPIPTTPKPVVVDRSLVVPPGPGAPAGTKAESIYDAPEKTDPSMYETQVDDNGNVTIIRKDTGAIVSTKEGVGKTAPPQKPIEGYDAQGNLVLVGYGGEKVPVPGVKHSDWTKMTLEQKYISSDKLYAQYVQKIVAGTATPAEKKAADLLAKFKEGMAIQLQQMQAVGEGEPVPGKTWQDEPAAPPPAAPKPEEKGVVGVVKDWFNGPPGALKTEPMTGTGTAYKFTVGKDSYPITGPPGKAPAAVKADMDKAIEALKKGIDLNTVLSTFEQNGYTVVRPKPIQ